MIRRRSGVVFGAGTDEEFGDVNPMESVANLVDAMLVFAVALMLALITRMSVDLTAVQLDSSELEPIDMSEILEKDSDTDSSSSGDSFYEVGKVYKNADGEMFLIS